MKNNKVLNFFISILQILMQMCVAVSAVNFLLHGFMKYEKFQAFNTLYICVVVFVYYLAKSFITNGKLALVVHAAAALSVLFVVGGAMEDKSLVFIPAVILGVFSMKKTKQEPFILLDMGVLAACYLVGFSIKSESATVIPFYCSIMYMTAFLIWYNLSNLNQLVIENSSVKSFNTEQAVNVNIVMMMIFMVVCAAVMYVMSGLNLGTLVKALIAFIWSGIVIVLRAIMPDIVKDTPKQDIIPENVSGGGYHAENLPVMINTQDGSMTLNIMAFVFAAVIIVCMMVMIIKAVMDLKYKKCQGNDVKEFVRPDFGKKDKTVKSEKRIKTFARSNDAAVRKLYMNTVTKNLKKGQSVNLSQTPKEISDNVIGAGEGAEKLTFLYEKARYSEENIKDEEIRNVQKLLKK